MVADMLGCSPNFVATKAREAGFPFPNNKSISSLEISVRDIIQNLGVTNIITGDRKILNGKELDILLPDYKVAIEVNGDYWHQHSMIEDQNYHKHKTDMAKEKGYSLIHLFEHDIANSEKMEKIVSVISNKINRNDRIYARKCQIKSISSFEYKQFLHKNHVKGPIASKYKYGLFHKDKLVMVIGFSKPRFNKKYQYELIRLCSESGKTIVGGASKLFNYFIRRHNPSNIISYCDRSIFGGEVYEKMGMIYQGTSSPNYYWVSPSLEDVKTRYMTQKHKIKDETNHHKTETQIMEEQGYMKIFDSGQGIYTWETG